jgi:hypothetical protein
MLPGVDHCRTGSRALAHEVDAVVTKRRARGLEVLDLLWQAVAREVDAVLGQPVSAGPEGVTVGTERALGEEVGRALER